MAPIELVCSACGNHMDYPRACDPTIPPTVVKIVSNECNKCEAARGGWGSEDWYDKDGNAVRPDGA